MRTARAVVGLVGVVLFLVGLRDVVGLGWTSLKPVLEWLVVGNILHDAILVPVVLAVGLAFVRLSPPWMRMPVVTGFVVLGTVTVLAIPVLGNFGDDTTNPSLMPRNYTAGWLVLAAVVGVALAVGCWWSWRHRSAGDDAERRTVQTVNTSSQEP